MAPKLSWSVYVSQSRSGSAAFRDRTQRVTDAIEGDLAIAQARAAERIEKLKPDAATRTPEALSSILKEELRLASNKSRQNVSALFDGVPNDLSLPLQPFNKALISLRKDISKSSLGGKAAIPADILSDIRKVLNTDGAGPTSGTAADSLADIDAIIASPIKELPF